MADNKENLEDTTSSKPSEVKVKGYTFKKYVKFTKYGEFKEGQVISEKSYEALKKYITTIDKYVKKPRT